MKNKKWSFQNLQVASDAINLKIISVKMALWITKMLFINDELIMCIFKVVTSDKQ